MLVFNNLQLKFNRCAVLNTLQLLEVMLENPAALTRV